MNFLNVIIFLLACTSANAEELPKPLKDSPVIADPVAAVISCDVFIEFHTVENGTRIYSKSFTLNTAENEYGYTSVDLKTELNLPSPLNGGAFSIGSNTAGASVRIESPRFNFNGTQVFSSDNDYSSEIDGAQLEASTKLTSSGPENEYTSLDSSVNCNFQEL